MVQETTGSGTGEAKDPAAGTMAKTDAQRDEEAAKLVDRFSLWSGAAGLIRFRSSTSLRSRGQLQMLRKLSDIYGVPFTENRGKSIIASMAGSLLPASATTTAMGAASMVKFIPGSAQRWPRSRAGVLRGPTRSGRPSFSILPRAGRC
jgi:hypothetical protein